MARVHTDTIATAFAVLVNKIKICSHLNLLDMNIHLENTLRDILNKIYSDRIFINLNTLKGNFTAIDLGDNIGDLAFQVTSDTTPAKIRETISKYKSEYNYKRVFMLYASLAKPKRKVSFEKEIEDKFVFEEWDFQTLISKINNCESHEVSMIQTILINEVLPYSNLIPRTLDNTASEEWDELNSKDVRNFRDKLLSVNSAIRDARVALYCREIASGKAELSNYPEREISAMKYRVFEICQRELQDFCEDNLDETLTIGDINQLITKYTNLACSEIEERARDYSYPIKNNGTIRKIVLALIDECYLSFDEEGIYI